MLTYLFQRSKYTIPLLLIFLPFLAGTSWSQYLTESFEGAWVAGAPPGWTHTVVSPDWYGGPTTWMKKTNPLSGYGVPSGGVAQQGTACAWFNTYNLSWGTEYRLESPSINLTTSYFPRVNFWFVNGGSDTDNLSVMISSDGGSSWTNIGTIGNTSSYSWTNYLVGIPAAYKQANIKIGFQAYSDYGYSDIWLDNAVVEDGTGPMYCMPSCNYPYYMGISNVTFGTINNSSCYGCNSNYSDYYSTLYTTVGPGQTKTLSVSWGGYPQCIKAWFDWNQDGDFYGPGEEFDLGCYGSSNGTASMNITIPLSALTGSTRWRVRSEYMYMGSPGPCGTVYYGEAEDYQLKIGSAPKMNLNPTTLTFNAEQNSATLPAAQNVTVTNIGAAVNMDWTATTIAVPAPNWLNAGPPTTGTITTSHTSDVVPVKPNRTSLAATMPFTTYSGTARFSSPQADNSPQDVAVTYNVTPQPHIDILTTAITVKVLHKKNVIAKKVTVYNTGGMFNGGLMAWSVTTTTPWISFVGPTTGVQGGSFSIMVDPGLNTPGTFTGSVILTAWNSATSTPADNSPLNVPVKMEIEPNSDYTGTQTINTPGTYNFNNAFGQRVFDITLISGMLGDFTVMMFPGQLPLGFARLRAPHRYYKFNTSRSPYNVNITLYYTGSEQLMGGVTKPELLTVWRQHYTGGSWANFGGTSDVFNNNVATTGITDLAGNWISGSAWYPKQITLTDFKVATVGKSDVAVEWKSNLIMNDEGFYVQRAPVGSEDWTTVVTIPSDASGAYTVRDNDVAKGRYQYQIVGIDKDGTPVASQIAVLSVGEIPYEFTLGQNYPNPFNPSTTIDFGLPMNGKVTLAVYNLVGKEIVKVINAKDLAAGNYSISFDASNLESGSYIYRLSCDGLQLSKRMTVVK